MVAAEELGLGCVKQPLLMTVPWMRFTLATHNTQPLNMIYNQKEFKSQHRN